METTVTGGRVTVTLGSTEVSVEVSVTTGSVRMDTDVVIDIEMSVTVLQIFELSSK